MTREEEVKAILDQHGYKGWKVIIQELIPFRSRVFRGDVADFILRRVAGQSIVFAEKIPSLSHQALQIVREYKECYAPEMAWLLWDKQGTYEFEIGGETVCGINLAIRAKTTKEPVREVSSLRSFFSPINQWLLKVLLLRELSAKMHEIAMR